MSAVDLIPAQAGNALDVAVAAGPGQARSSGDARLRGNDVFKDPRQ